MKENLISGGEKFFDSEARREVRNKECIKNQAGLMQQIEQSR